MLDSCFFGLSEDPLPIDHAAADFSHLFHRVAKILLARCSDSQCTCGQLPCWPRLPAENCLGLELRNPRAWRAQSSHIDQGMSASPAGTDQSMRLSHLSS